MENEILKVEKLNITIQKQKKVLKIVKDFDLTVKKEEIIGIVGESGSGKSMSMKAIMNILPEGVRRVANKLSLEDIDLINAGEKKYQKIRGKEIAMIFQDPMKSLDPIKRIGLQIEEVILRHSNITKKEAREKAVSLLKKAGITEAEKRIKQYPHEFSGGMRQRVMIAMALSCNPEILIADEPTTALDVTIQAQILKLLLEIQRENNMSIIFITHDMGVISKICQKVMVMYAGFVVEEGDKKEIFNNPKHPYTIALLKAVPSLDLNKKRLVAIEGKTPSLNEDFKLCPFLNRCDKKIEICNEVMPEYKYYGNKQKVKCHICYE
ncbi:ABC transporter ATP-binding protein [Miniphocaeibacter massiliensis]|uniref:ABC transporter ATP-binding protein n=1 Tax=Miniphocaeibacter massiliensis TaxID=2041841 RepID=UPI000C1BF0BD|nr:ABC transporter ATP-binding protein [Miniphocaeibacter massiliensis]